MLRAVYASVALSVLVACQAADPRAEGNREASAAVFERLKTLDGRWSGTGTIGDQVIPIESTWRVTGAGSAVEEVLFVGTPHEMVTMYHLDGTRLMLTHYCAAQNQPRMVAMPAKQPSGAAFAVQFAYLDCTNLASPTAMHMHDAQLELDADGVMRSRWSAWSGGKPDHDAVFELRRK